jgi:MoxR-like ATPase
MLTTNDRDFILKTIKLSDDALDYYADEGLRKAFEIAVALNKPLPLSGEPGTGKTKFAHYAAKKLSIQTEKDKAPFLPKPFVFPVKSTSVANDLFYTYDAVGHFRNKDENKGAQAFITLQAMGLAFAETHEGGSAPLELLKGIPNFKKAAGAGPRSSVVLIDEIDKAPREFPNDLLHEMENYECWMSELSSVMERNKAKDAPARIAVIITSNSEKNLPNAFLRRCVFYHIEFPEGKLLEIAKLKMNLKNDNRYNTHIEKAIKNFMDLRASATNKKPTTSEFLEWVAVLRDNGLLDASELPPTPVDPKQPTDAEQTLLANYAASGTVLVKTTDDKGLQ